MVYDKNKYNLLTWCDYVLICHLLHRCCSKGLRSLVYTYSVILIFILINLISLYTRIHTYICIRMKYVKGIYAALETEITKCNLIVNNPQ